MTCPTCGAPFAAGKMMKIQDPPQGFPSHVPYALLSEDQAEKNHGQTLDRLNERGGLSAGEALANIYRQRLHPMAMSSDEECVRLWKGLKP